MLVCHGFLGIANNQSHNNNNNNNNNIYVILGTASQVPGAD
jgi:hypothetical protein